MITLGHLPNEILSLIVEHVGAPKDVQTCALLNKQFRSISTPLLWRTLNVSDAGCLLRITTGFFLSPQLLGQHVRQLFLHVRLTNTTFLLLMKHFTLLEELSIHDGQLITDASFQYLPQHCPQLKSLVLNDASITRHSMNGLGQCQHLRRLDLDCCMRLSPDSFSSLVDCPLVDLAISGDDPSGFYGKHWMTPQTTKDLTQFALLTHLTIADWSTPFFASILDTDTAWPHLTHLHLEECIDIGDTHLIPFIKSHPRLKYIHLTNGKATDMTLDALSCLPGLTGVTLIGHIDITSRGVYKLIQHCPLLQYLYFKDCWIGLEDNNDGDTAELLRPAIERIRRNLVEDMMAV